MKVKVIKEFGPDVDEIQTTEALNIIAGYIERGEHFLRDDENG
jgi:hypothetical protein